MGNKESKNVYFSRDVALRAGYKLLNEDGPYLSKNEKGKQSFTTICDSILTSRGPERTETGWLEKAEVEHNKNNYKKEIDYLKKALKHDFNYQSINWLLANAYTHLKNYTKAIKYYGRVLEAKHLRKKSILSLSYYNLAVVHERLGKIQIAIENYRTAGKMFFVDKDLDNYIKAIESIARLDPYSKYIGKLIDMSKNVDYDVVQKHLKKFIKVRKG